MKIDTKLQDDHQAKLTVEVEPEVLEGAKRKAARHIAKRIKIPGFRPGKAPYNVVEKQVGPEAILEDALDHLLEDIYPKIIEEAELDPYGPGSLQNIASMEPPTFEFTIPLSPAVELSDYKKLRIPFKQKKVTKKDVDKVLKDLQEQQAVLELVEREAVEGDMIYVRVKGERVAVKEAAKTSLFEERRLPVVIEKEETDDKDEWPYPGFSRQLLGLKAKDNREFAYTFPKDYETKELQGAGASFSVTVEEIKGRTLPELNDEFATSLGEYESLDDLKGEIETSLRDRNESEQNAEYDDKIFDKLIKETGFKYPPQMVEHEVEHAIEDIERDLRSQGMDMETYLKSREIDEQVLHEELSEPAVERIKRSLLLMEIAKAEDIEVSEQDVKERTEKTIEEIKQIFPEDQARRLTSGQSLQSLVNRIINDQIVAQTLERLRAISKGEEIKTEKPEAEKKEQDDDEEKSEEVALSEE